MRLDKSCTVCTSRSSERCFRGSTQIGYEPRLERYAHRDRREDVSEDLHLAADAARRAVALTGETGGSLQRQTRPGQTEPSTTETAARLGLVHVPRTRQDPHQRVDP